MNALTGTGELGRLALRRDRVLLPVWIAVFVLVAASSATATVGLYPTVESRIQAAAGINNVPVLVALYGRIYDPTSLGALAMLKMSVFGAALVAILAMFTVIRHTRAEEETGRLELIGATGRRPVCGAERRAARDGRCQPAAGPAHRPGPDRGGTARCGRNGVRIGLGHGGYRVRGGGGGGRATDPQRASGQGNQCGGARFGVSASSHRRCRRRGGDRVVVLAVAVGLGPAGTALRG